MITGVADCKFNDTEKAILANLESIVGGKKELKKYDLLNDNSKELEALIEKYNSIVREINSHLLDNIK